MNKVTLKRTPVGIGVFAKVEADAGVTHFILKKVTEPAAGQPLCGLWPIDKEVTLLFVEPGDSVVLEAYGGENVALMYAVPVKTVF